jgi:type III secretion protein T
MAGPGALVLGPWADQALLLGVASTRIAVAFVMLPLLSPDVVPATVRNSILLSLGLVSLAVNPPLVVSALTVAGWLALYAKELLVGVIIGFFFGAVLYAMEAAGQIIDAKVGATMAQVVDPLSGHQTSLNGALLGRLANLVFVFSGGLTLLVLVLLESYAIWPIAATFPRLAPAGLALFETEFGRLMALATLLAAPVLTVLYVIDGALGLVNRFAQQLNVFQLSMSIKAFAVTALMLLLVPALAGLVAADIRSRPETLRNLLKGLE